MNWNTKGNYGNQGGGYQDPPDEPKQRYPNSGALFPVKQKRSDNSPDLTGNVLIADDVLDYIQREAERGGDVKMELSAWIRTGRNNNTFTSIRINIPYDQRVLNQNPTYQARPNFNARQTERQPPPARSQGYAEQSGRSQGGRIRTDPHMDRRSPPPPSQEEFASGDRMPDFLRDDDDDPHKPPF